MHHYSKTQIHTPMNEQHLNRSKLLILCETILQVNAHAAEYNAKPTQFNLQRQRVLNNKLLELTKKYQDEAMQEITEELEEEVRQKQKEGTEPKRYKNEETDK